MIDPFDVPKVAEAVDKEGVKVVANITTHHHNDHAGGNDAFVGSGIQEAIKLTSGLKVQSTCLWRVQERTSYYEYRRRSPDF